MSSWGKVDSLPEPESGRNTGRAPHPVWVAAKAEPGTWFRTPFSKASTHRLKADHQGFEVTQRQGVIYVRWPAPATNGRKRR